MNTTLSKPYRPVWLAIPIIMGLAIVGINSAIGLQLHGTYLVITPIHLGVWLSIILGGLNRVLREVGNSVKAISPGEG